MYCQANPPTHCQTMTAASPGICRATQEITQAWGWGVFWRETDPSDIRRAFTLEVMMLSSITLQNTMRSCRRIQELLTIQFVLFHRTTEKRWPKLNRNYLKVWKIFTVAHKFRDTVNMWKRLICCRRINVMEEELHYSWIYWNASRPAASWEKNKHNNKSTCEHSGLLVSP